MKIKIDETYHVASCCCPLSAHKVSGKIVSFIFPKDVEAIFPETSCATTLHGVSLIDFYFRFLANFQT